MGERYEIKGKIGQGGLGAVYKAYDTRMSRDVAIKRIVANPGDVSISDEATRQLIKEAGALSALQHPNIVTIYDVGTDEDGPFVVMELLAGHTLEDIVIQGSFTWPDFRQFALQTLEAMIAAQELNLVHRDLKPTNIMVTWLPSGKFQVKIVDFGLAKLSAAPTLQTVDQHDGVFGSIYFMAPEQFERVPIGPKADIYAIGCVFYYALTGNFPFDGDTAATVMASHLQHHVTPLQEVREGIPTWACDWVMWHINRYPADRPESARQALQYFLDNDTLQPNPELSTGQPAPVIEQPKRPKLVIPGSAPTPEVITESVANQPTKTASVPRPILPPDGSKPSVHTSVQVIHTGPATQSVQAEAPVTTPSTPASPEPAAAATPTPALVATPLVTAKPGNVPKTTSTQQSTGNQKLAPTPLQGKTISTVSVEEEYPYVPEHLLPPKKKSLPPIVKTIIAVALGLAVIIAALLYLKRSGDNAETLQYNTMMELARQNKPVPVDKNKLDILLRTATSIAYNNDRAILSVALINAKADDKTDIDATIVDFVLNKEMNPTARITLIQVLGRRKSSSVISQLITFINGTADKPAAAAALYAIRDSASEAHTGDIIAIIQKNSSTEVLSAAENVLEGIIERSQLTNKIADEIFAAFSTATAEPVRHTFLRLIGLIGGPKALAIAKENLNSQSINDKYAAIAALNNCKSNESLAALLEFLTTQTDPSQIPLRKSAHQAALSICAQPDQNFESNWQLLRKNSKTEEEFLNYVRALTQHGPPEAWTIQILKEIAEMNMYESVKEDAATGANRVRERRALQGN